MRGCIRFFILVFVTVGMISPSYATTDAYRTIVPAIYDPSTPGNTSTLYGGSLASSVNQVTVTCYHPASDSSVCAGGGPFDKGSCPSGGTPTNFGTIIQDAVGTGQCWYRKNFGLNGIVDARQCGVYGDGIHDDYAALNACLGLASTLSTAAPLQNKLEIVSTGGGVILDNTADIEVPQNTELTCGGTGTGSPPKNPAGKDDDYRITNITNAIVLDPTLSHGTSPNIFIGYAIYLHNDNTTLSGCTIEAGGGTPNAGTNQYPNPYSPSIWYPYCKPSSPATAIVACDEHDNPILRSSIQEYSAFNPHPTNIYLSSTGGPAAASAGIRITNANNVTVRNTTVLGFGTCYSSNPGSRLVIEYMQCDGDTGINVNSSPTFTRFNGFEVRPFLNSSLNQTNASALTMQVDWLGDDGTGKYQAVVEVSTGTFDFNFANNDTVWISTDSTTGAESAAGRWTATNVQSETGSHCTAASPLVCQKFTLSSSVDQPDSRYSSSTSPMTISAATVNNSSLAPNAISGIATDPTSSDQKTLQLVAVGQSVTGTCIPPLATVTDVWPAKGLVYMSLPATCTSIHIGAVNFYDGNFTTNCATNTDRGCWTVNATQRFGDGIVVANSGGVAAVNCQVYEHLTAFHLYTNANNSRFANCATGENAPLPDQDIVGLKIDGDHSTDHDAPGDACGNDFVNSILGQHRTVGILVQSDCTTPNHLSGLRFSGHPGGRRNAIGLEMDAGTVALTNSDASGGDNVLIADATQLYPTNGTMPSANPAPALLSIGNNQFPNAHLYMSNTQAVASTVGCGNTFPIPTPYLCAPGTFVQPPGGRLTLTPGQPVMTSDVVNGATVYYAPYTGQQMPIYSSQSGAFGLADMGSAGLSLSLHTTQELASKLYDIFAETIGGSVELCAGTAWSNSTAGSSIRAVGLTQIYGIYVNSAEIASCFTSNALVTRDCPAFACTYLGTMYMTLNGRTSQQLGPDLHAGGNGNCLCLYNAYNQVSVTSESLDSHIAYTYASINWHPLQNSTGNSINVVDGLGQMAISSKLVDALTQTGWNAAIGIDLNSTSVQPTLIVQSNISTQGSYTAVLNHPPVQGLWYAQAVEAAFGSGSGNATFGGSGYQDLSVQVRD